MEGQPSATEIAGIAIPSSSPLFLAGVAIHVAAGLVCVVAGALAMFSRKQRGRHSVAGSVYFWGLAVVCGSAGLLAAVRWTEDYVLFALAVTAFTAAMVARSAIRRRAQPLVEVHVVGMAVSYIVLLTAFYVDNGKSLPLWRDLPPVTFWLAPGAIGFPILIYTLKRHPLLRR
jgi:hypothetical protein